MCVDVNGKACGVCFKLAYFLKTHLRQVHGVNYYGLLSTIFSEIHSHVKTESALAPNLKSKVKARSSRNIMASVRKRSWDMNVQHCKDETQSMSLSMEVEEIEDLSLYQDTLKNVKRVYGKKIEPKTSSEIIAENEKSEDRAKPEFLCKRCSVLFFTKEDLFCHVKFAHKLPPPASSDYTTCMDCNERFHIANFPRHVADCPKQSRKRGSYKYSSGPHICDICGGSYKCWNNFLNHQRRHTGDLFFCETCGKGSTSKSGLREHMKTHLTAKPFKCDECGRRFKSEALVESHKVTHRDVYPHQCEKCGKEFRQRQALRTHNLMYHSDTWNHCPHCECRFKVRFQLKRHIAMAHEEHVFQCNHCSQTFGIKKNLTRHLRNVHNIKPGHGCKKCGQRFDGIRKLEKHKTKYLHWSDEETPDVVPVKKDFTVKTLPVEPRLSNTNGDADENVEVAAEEEVLNGDIKLEPTNLTDQALNQFIYVTTDTMQGAKNVVLRVVKK